VNASENAPKEPLVGVAYPSVKPSVHPLKIETRMAIQRFKDAGVEIRQTGRGFPGVFSLVKHAPELLEEIIEAASASDGRGKCVWGELLSSHYTAMNAESTVYVFTLDLQIALLAAETMRIKPSYQATDALVPVRSVMAVIRQVRDVRPETKYFTSIVPAYELYAGLQGRIYGSFIDRRQNRINRDTIDDIEFIAENLDAVKAIYPALVKRKTTDRGIIAEMIKSGNKPMLDGIL
jgi:hypothetical protein